MGQNQMLVDPQSTALLNHLTACNDVDLWSLLANMAISMEAVASGHHYIYIYIHMSDNAQVAALLAEHDARGQSC